MRSVWCACPRPTRSRPGRKRDCGITFRMRRMAEGRGRCLLLAHGFTAEKYWWRKTKWDALQPRLPDWLRLLIAEWQAVALDLDTRERTLRAQLEAAAPKELPKGIGAL